MKHLVRPLWLAAVLAALLCVSAFATAEDGFDKLEAKEGSGVTLVAQKADKTEAAKNAETGIYEDSVRIALTYSGATVGKEYLVIVTNKETTAPQKDDILYIDQTTAVAVDGATDGAALFNIYPSELKTGTEYHIYLSSNATTGITTLTEVGEATYHQAYILGDVNADKKIDSRDAALVLRHDVQIALLTGSAFSAGDVNKDKKVDSRDAALILRYDVGLIEEF